MVAFLDVVPSGSGRSLRHSKHRQVQKTRCAGRSPLAGFMRFTGIVLMLAGAGMWIVSVPQLDAEMMLVRLAASILLLCAGLMLLRGGRGQMRDELELDPRCGELRHVQRGHDGIARTRRCFKIAELGAITFVDDQVIVRSVTGDVVMHLSGLPRAQLHLIERRLRRI